jgi:hypothetical protein
MPISREITLAARMGFEPPTAGSVGWCSASTQCACVLSMRLRSRVESSQIAGVQSGDSWWTDIGTDATHGPSFHGPQ